MPSFPTTGSFLFLTGVTVAVYTGKIPAWVLWIYIGASVVTFAVYGHDKSAARKGLWRTKENTLHVLALMGGWPGAVFAQKVFHHKTHKHPFRMLFWITVIFNGGLFMWVTMNRLWPK
jgi:uncharacterized membrane protein YsdA (DUF1294 family)